MPLLITLSPLVTLELSIQTGKVEEFLAIVHDGFEVSRNYSENQRCNTYLDQEKPGKLLFIGQRKSE
jgi:hypothetical protein